MEDTNVMIRLLAERQRVGLTRERVAHALDVADRTVARWEKNIAIPADKLECLARLGMDVQYILTGKRSRDGVGQQSEATLSVEEMDVVQTYRMLNSEDRGHAKALLRALRANGTAMKPVSGQV